jgi:hypothetical protein
MKKFTVVRKLTVVLSLLICAAIIAVLADRRWGSYRLRFVESATQKPIAGTTFLLVPRIIILNTGPSYSVDDPNLKYATSITTDSNGYATLRKCLIDDLTTKGKTIIDSQSKDYARFCLSRNSPILPIGGDHITVFHSNNIVSDQVALDGFHDNLLHLERSSSLPSSNTNNR